MPISLSSPEKRALLDARDTPYYERVSDALHIGYRKGKSVSRWVVRWRVRSGYVSRVLRGVVVDDEVPANNFSILSYEQALERIMEMSIENATCNEHKHCALCGLTQPEVNVLLTGVNSFVCDQCVKRGSDILAITDLSGLQEYGLVEVLLNPGIEFQIHCSDLTTLLEKTSPAMGDQDERQILNGLLIEIEKGKIRAVATNGHWLAACEVSVDHNLEKRQHLILGGESVYKLLKQLKLMGGELTVSIKDNCFCVDSDTEIYRAELLLGTYPNYRKVLPNHPHSVILDREKLLSAVKKQEVNEEFKGMYLTLSKGELLVRGEKAGDWDVVNVDYSGETIKTGFNQTYLVNILQLVEVSKVKIEFQRAATVWQFEAAEDASAVYLVMPMRIE